MQKEDFNKMDGKPRRKSRRRRENEWSRIRGRGRDFDDEMSGLRQSKKNKKQSKDDWMELLMEEEDYGLNDG